MRKLGNINYDMVEEKSLLLLKEKSKDIRVLSFLSFVYLRNDNWENFSSVFNGLAQLCEQDYEKLFPIRDRPKQEAFKWLSLPRYIDTLEAKKPKEDSYDYLKILLSSLLKLKDVLEKHVKDGSPFPSRILQIVQKWEKSLQPKDIPKELPKTEPKPEQIEKKQIEPEVKSQTEQTQTPPSRQESLPIPAPVTPPPVISNKMKNTKQAQMDCRKIAVFLIENEPEKPLGYRLLRLLQWDLIEKAPVSENGLTRLEPPSADRIAFINNLILKKEWKRALITAEKEFCSGSTHFLLDLQRISSTACKELGNNYITVNSAICYETALFLKRIPDLLSLLYSNGTPFCDNATKDWIDSDITQVQSSHGSPVKRQDEALSDPLKNEKKEIFILSSAGKIDEAIQIMQKNINDSGSKNQNFKRELVICNLLFSAKRADIALAILESLHEKIAYYHLDEWEPQLAVEAWGLLVKAYKIVGNSKPQNIQITFLERQNSILNKISCIDPNSSLKIKL